jgi:two-component system sensor histidine kinase CiaH
MFKKTRLRLVLLNSIVFLLLLNGFGATLYFYMQHKLYNQVDASLYEELTHLQRGHFAELMRPPRRRDRETDRRPILLWDAEGHLLKQTPDQMFTSEELNQFRPGSLEEGLQTITLDDLKYRVYNVPLLSAPPLPGGNSPVMLLQLIYDLTPEQNMLENLWIVMEVCSLLSAGIAVLAGFFLADRALVPIQRSWNKQQQFVADASHELRTPLSVLLMHLERLFRHPDHTIEQESDRISVMIRETKRMNKLVADLLTLARTDSNQLQILYEKIRLDEVLHRVVEQFREVAALKNITIETSIESPVQMDGDEERLHQLFVILLDNALKYTHEGTITVTCHTSSSSAHILVKDTGEGIAKEDLPYIFDRFYRGDKARSREGTGLGLAIAEWIIQSHNGKVKVESQPGVGTSFFITLPLRRK